MVVQIQFCRARRGKHVAYFKELPCVGLQLDLWTDRNTGICYAAVHESFCTDPTCDDGDRLELQHSLLHFRAFPFTRHTKEMIRDWLVGVLLAEEIPASAISGVTPDGASDVQSGGKLVPGLARKVDVCLLHDLQRSVLYSMGLAGSVRNCPNRGFRDVMRINKRVVMLAHQSREV